MKEHRIVFTYSETYDNKEFAEPFKPDVFIVKTPDEVPLETVTSLIEKVNSKMNSLSVSEDFALVKEGEGYDWYGNGGRDVDTLLSVVCGVRPDWSFSIEPTTVIDFDTL